MEKQLLVFLSLVAVFAATGGEKLPKEHGLQKRSDHDDPWKIRAFWESCTGRRIKVEVYDTVVTYVNVNIKIRQILTSVEEIDTNMEFFGAGGADSFQVESCDKAYEIVWYDKNNVSRSEKIIVPKCWNITGYWDTCQAQRIRVDFANIDETPINIEVKVYQVAIDLTLTIQCQETLVLVTPVAVAYTHCNVTSCINDYFIEWTDLNNTDHNGNLTVTKCLSGQGWGDPHMRTFSGVKFNFQGPCSYTLVRDCGRNTPTFDISATFRKRGGRDSPTRMVAVTTRVRGGHEYVFQEDNSILFNGLPILDRELPVVHSMGHIRAGDGSVEMNLHEDDVTVEWVGKDHEVSISIGNDRLAGQLCGMLGDGTSVRGHDLVKSDGTRTFNTTEFAESWIIPGSCP